MKRLLSAAALLLALAGTAASRPVGACRLASFGRDRPGDLEDRGPITGAPAAPELVSAIEWYPRDDADAAGCACGETEPLCGPAAYVDLALRAPSAGWARVSLVDREDALYYQLTQEGEVARFRIMLHELGAGLPKHVELSVAVLDAEGRRSAAITVRPDLMDL